MSEKHPSEDSPETRDTEISRPSEGAGGDFFVTFVGKLGGDTLRYIPALVVPAVMGFLGVAIYTRIFQPASYGQYSLVIAATVIPVAVSGGWLAPSVMRYLPRYREQSMLDEFKATLSTLLVIVVIVVVTASSAFYVAGRSFLGVYQSFYFPCVLLVVSTVVYAVCTAAFAANLQAGIYARYQIIQAVGKLLFALLYVMLISRNVVGLIIGAVVAHAVLFPPILRELDVLGSFRRASRILDTEFVKKSLVYGFPIVGQAMAIWVLDLSDRFVIGLFKGPDQVGIYAANYNLATNVIALAAGPVLFAAHPLIVNAWEGGNRARIQEVIATCSRYFLLVTPPIGVFASVFARQIASVLFGEAFREGFLVVPLVTSGMILFNFGMYGHKGIKLLEKTGLLFAMVLVCAAVNVGLNLVLVPPYGYFGAAMATFFSYALYPMMVFGVTKRYLPWLIPWRSIRNIGAASLAAAGFWWLLRIDLTSALDWIVFTCLALAGFTIYVVMLFLVGEVRDYEKNFLKAQIARIRGKTVDDN
jgi:O-antigen/teichoic acid export membrane protein